MKLQDYTYQFGVVQRKGAEPEEDIVLLREKSRTAVWLVASKHDGNDVLSGYAARGSSVRRVVVPMNGGHSKEKMEETALMLVSYLDNLVIYPDRENGDGPTHISSASVRAALTSGKGNFEEANAEALRTPRSFESFRDQMRRYKEADERDTGGLHAPSKIRETGVSDSLDGFSFHKVFKVMIARINRLNPEMAQSLAKSVKAVDLENAKNALSAIQDPTLYAVNFYGVKPEAPPADAIERDGKHFIKDEEGREREWVSKAEKRIRAAQSFPIMAEYMASDPEIAEAIDNDGPVFPLVRERTGLGKGALKSLRALDKLHRDIEMGAIVNALGAEVEDAGGVKSIFDLDTAFRILRDVPPEWVPTTSQEWQDFVDVTTAVLLPMQNSLGIDYNDVLKGQHKRIGGWSGLRRALINAVGVDNPEMISQQSLACMTRDALMTIEQVKNDVVYSIVSTTAIPNGIRPSQAMEEDARKAALEFALRHAPVKGTPYVRIFSLMRAVMPRQHILLGSRIMQDADAAAAEEVVKAYDGDFPPWRENNMEFSTSKGYKLRMLDSFAEMDRHGHMQANCIPWPHNKAPAETMEHIYIEVLPPYLADTEKKKLSKERKNTQDIGSLNLFVGQTDLKALPILGRKYVRHGTKGCIGVREYRTSSGQMFPQPDPNREQMDAMVELLDSFSVEEIDALVDRHLAQARYIRERGSKVDNRIGNIYSPQDRARDEWASITGVSMNDTAKSAVYIEWRDNIFSGIPEETPMVALSQAPAMRALFEKHNVPMPAVPQVAPQEPEQNNGLGEP